MTWVRVVLAAALVAGAAPACGGGDRGGDVPSTAGCAETRLEVEPVNGKTVDDIVFAGRLTVDGKPLPGQTLYFAIRVTDEGGNIWRQTAPTGPDGRAAADFADAIRRVRKARTAFDEGRILQAEFINPAEERRSQAPGWCSKKTRIPFEPVR